MFFLTAELTVKFILKVLAFETLDLTTELSLSSSLICIISILFPCYFRIMPCLTSNVRRHIYIFILNFIATTISLTKSWTPGLYFTTLTIVSDMCKERKHYSHGRAILNSAYLQNTTIVTQIQHSFILMSKFTYDFKIIMSTRNNQILVS